MTYPHPPQLPPPGPSATQAQAAVQAALRRIGQALADAHREVHAAVTMLAPTRPAAADQQPGSSGEADPTRARPAADSGDGDDVLARAVEAAAHAQEQAEQAAQALVLSAMAADGIAQDDTPQTAR